MNAPCCLVLNLALASGLLVLAPSAGADPIVMPSPTIGGIAPPYGPGFDNGVVLGPGDGCRTVVNCPAGDFANRPAHRRYYDGYFAVPAPEYSPQRRIDGNPSISGPGRTMALSRHLEWCAERYRSYRASDDTFQPLNGARKPCISPF